MRLSHPSRASLLARAFSLVLVFFILLWIAGFLFVSRSFGPSAALLLSLITVLPLLVAFGFRLRWPAVRGSEFVLLLILAMIATGSTVFVLRDWFDKGMDARHAEDQKWAAFEGAFRRDPAFKNVRIRESPKSRWVCGTIGSEADRTRLERLARRFGIDQGRLDGPLPDDASLTVETRDGARSER